MSSTFASRSRSTSRSRAEGPKTGEDKREVEPRRNRSRSVSWGRDNLGDGKTSTRYLALLLHSVSLYYLNVETYYHLKADMVKYKGYLIGKLTAGIRT